MISGGRDAPRRRPLRRALAAIAVTSALVLAGIEVASRLRWLPCFGKQPGVWEPHASFGWFHRPAVQGWGQGCLGNEVEWRATVGINSLGLRDVEHDHEKRDGAYRILILGDSFIEGFNVDFADHFLPRLRAKLAGLSPRIEVIGAGVSAWGTDQELLYFLEEGIKYHPDLVVLAFNPGNDVAENSPGVGLPKPRVAKKPSFTLDGRRLTLRDHPIHVPEHEAGWLATVDDVLARRTHAYAVLRYLAGKLWPAQPPGNRKRRGTEHGRPVRPAAERAAPARSASALGATPAAAAAAAAEARAATRRERGDAHDDVPVETIIALDPLPPKWQAAWELTEALVLDLKKRVEATGARFAATIVPSKFAVGGPRVSLMTGWERADIDATVPERRTEEFFAAAQIPTCSLLPRFRSHLAATGRNGFFAFDIHWSEDGHRIVADALAECLTGMIPERVLPRP